MACTFTPSMTEPGCVVTPTTFPPQGVPHYTPTMPTLPSALPHHATGLAFTGANIEYLFGLGIVLLAVGALLLIRRRVDRDRTGL